MKGESPHAGGEGDQKAEAKSDHKDVSDARTLDVFPKVRQKKADLGWWVDGVHQIMVWVGNARPGKQSHARFQ